jgi:hypothetical protein
MKPLSKPEKEEHAAKLAQFIAKITPNIPYLANGDLILKQVCYIVPLDSEDFYFDFPYNIIADKFNKDLNDNDLPIGRASDRTIILFNNFQATKNVHPFIYYKYHLDNDQSKFFVHELQSNIDTTTASTRETMVGYLPIVHQGSYLQHPDTHNATVVEGKSTEGTPHELLTLYWPMSINDKLVKNTSIACSLEVRPGFQIDHDFELEELLYYINQYFNSPVLTKIINDKRISEILIYQHSFKNLALSDSLFAIDKLSKGFSIEDQLKWKKERNKITAWRFFSDIFFKIEQIDNNLGMPAVHHKLLQGIEVLLRFYADELNYFGIDTQIVVAKEVGATHKLPEGKKLYDLAIVIWNVIENAWKESYKQNAEKINIEVSIKNTQLCIKFTNKGKMPPELVAHCRGSASYPTVDTTGINPVRGLQIIRAKCEFNNWQLLVDIDKLDTTEISITF